ncbi:hypothetical protein DOTSEDRAFT_73926 [Dothistroma septosporum NZE10]|uniref:Uncharacterized protein n=1 Tax=Dothistroma septosporum (strain NZE10 / CBS 128990) TaxID=675120 RepID=N1PJI8_DOTSN|nr:hypothetical protein DOTSEDRAFT_73926 [Dothistroma septosporum NZE10]
MGLPMFDMLRAGGHEGDALGGPPSSDGPSQDLLPVGHASMEMGSIEEMKWGKAAQITAKREWVHGNISMFTVASVSPGPLTDIFSLSLLRWSRILLFPDGGIRFAARPTCSPLILVRVLR